MIRRPPRSTPLYSSAASDVYKRQGELADTARTLDPDLSIKHQQSRRGVSTVGCIAHAFLVHHMAVLASRLVAKTARLPPIPGLIEETAAGVLTHISSQRPHGLMSVRAH